MIFTAITELYSRRTRRRRDRIGAAQGGRSGAGSRRLPLPFQPTRAIATSTTAGYYASELRNLWLKREILRAETQRVKGARDGLTVPEFTGLAERTLLSIGTDQAGRDAPVAELTDAVLTELDEATSNPGQLPRARHGLGRSGPADQRTEARASVRHCGPAGRG